MQQQPVRLFGLPLLKYSRAADAPREADQFTWTHFQHNLSVVFDAHDASSQMLKVLNGAEVLVRLRRHHSTMHIYA